MLVPQDAGFHLRIPRVFSPVTHLCSILLLSGLSEIRLLIIDNFVDF